jgi:hypothetical protein
MNEFQGKDSNVLLIATPGARIRELQRPFPVYCTKQTHELYGRMTLLVDAVKTSDEGGILFVIGGKDYDSGDFGFVDYILRKIAETLRHPY